MVIVVRNKRATLTFIVILDGDFEHRELNVLVLLNFRLVQCLVEERRVVIFISDSDANEFRY